CVLKNDSGPPNRKSGSADHSGKGNTMKTLAITLVIFCCGSAFGQTITASNINNVLWVDGTSYHTLADCYNALRAAGGGVCMVPPNYSETLTAPLILNQNYTAIIFTGPATINMGSNNIVLPNGAQSIAVESWIPFGNAFLPKTSGVTFVYQGTGHAFDWGGSTRDTLNIRLKDIKVDLSSAGPSAVGINFQRIQLYELRNVWVVGKSGPNSQVGIALNGTGSYVGGGQIIDPNLNGLNIGILFEGSPFGANINQILGGSINSGNGSGPVGFDIESGDGNMILGTDIETETTAFKLGPNASNNEIHFRTETNTTDVLLDSASSNNRVTVLNSSSPRVSGAGVSNLITGNTFPLGANLETKTLALDGAGPNTYALTVNNGPSIFYGDLWVQGTLYKQAGSFRIDHPLDPEHKYLLHSFVESPDMKNIYDGIAILDSKGRAEITLPPYFEALNQDFRYQLTCIGRAAPVFVAKEIKANHFVIAGGKPGQKISWQVTGVRHDTYANTHRIAVEEEKPHPESKAH
ncbi:MAG TPA: hypothetical protein VI685_14800, partial [Candidatus Angelobacter sp.]